MSVLRHALVLGIVLVVCLVCCERQVATAGDKIVIEKIALLNLPGRDRFPGNHAFRSVALRFPWTYVLDRKGTLYIFRIPKPQQVGMGRVPELQPTKTIDKVGDGNDLCALESVLLFTQHGALRVYSLEDPGTPQYVGQFGPARNVYHSQTIVLDGKRAFLVGRNAIVTYALSDPLKPDHLTTYRGKVNAWTGCVSGEYLYVGGSDHKQQRVGISVFNVRDRNRLQYVGFVPTTKTPYHVFALPGKRLLASLDADTRFRFYFGAGGAVHGKSALLTIKEPTAPRLLEEIGGSGGRTSIVMSFADKQFFACNGNVFSIGAESLTPQFPFFPHGSTLDGLPYHGDTDDKYAAIAMDSVTMVLRFVGKE